MAKTATEVQSIANKINIAIDATEHDLRTLRHYDERFLITVHKIEITKNLILRLTNLLEDLVKLKCEEDK